MFGWLRSRVILLGVVWVCGLLVLVGHMPVWSQDYPMVKDWLVDQPGVLTPDQNRVLKSDLQKFRLDTGNQLAVLIVSNLGGQDINEYANRVFENSGIGEKGKDNGLLLVVSIEERQVRFEVGYGLEGYYTDAYTKKIIEEQLVPAFSKGQYFQGIQSSIQSMAAVDTSDLSSQAASTSNNTWFKTLITVLFVGVFGILSYFGVRSGRVRRVSKTDSNSVESFPVENEPKNQKPNKSQALESDNPDFGGGRSGGGGSQGGW